MTLETAFDLPFWFEFAATVTGGLSGGMSAVRARYDIFGTVAIACITGMGGAGFHTSVKLSSGLGKVDTVIVNGAECEPYITSDDRLMRETPERVVGGLRVDAGLLEVFMVFLLPRGRRSL